MLAFGCLAQRRRTCSASVVASFKPCVDEGRFFLGTSVSTAKPRCAYAIAASASDVVSENAGSLIERRPVHDQLDVCPLGIRRSSRTIGDPRRAFVLGSRV